MLLTCQHSPPTSRWTLACPPGLSVFLPLQNVAADRGPQELLPGTHALHVPRLQKMCGVLSLDSWMCGRSDDLQLERVMNARGGTLLQVSRPSQLFAFQALDRLRTVIGFVRL